MSEGFTRNGKWAPSLGDWLAERLTTDLAEVLCQVKCVQITSKQWAEKRKTLPRYQIKRGMR